MDNMLGITHVIRGDDFATEYSLYCYFCQRFNFPTPEFIFLPRLASTMETFPRPMEDFKFLILGDDGYTAEKLKECWLKHAYGILIMDGRYIILSQIQN